MSTIRSLSVLLSVALVGCASGLRDGWDDVAISRQNRRMAESAWETAEPIYAQLPYLDDFEDGFRAGYVAVAEGHSGDAPVLPDRKYWKAAYRNPEGHGRAHAWLDGYAHGAVAADHDGVAHWNRIPIATPAVAPSFATPHYTTHPNMMPDPALPGIDPTPGLPMTAPVPAPPATEDVPPASTRDTDPSPPDEQPPSDSPVSIPVPVPPPVPAPAVPETPLIFPGAPGPVTGLNSGPEFTTQQVPHP